MTKRFSKAEREKRICEIKDDIATFDKWHGSYIDGLRLIALKKELEELEEKA